MAYGQIALKAASEKIDQLKDNVIYLQEEENKNSELVMASFQTTLKSEMKSYRDFVVEKGSSISSQTFSSVVSEEDGSRNVIVYGVEEDGTMEMQSLTL